MSKEKMTEAEVAKVAMLLEIIEETDVVEVDDSPYLSNFEIEEPRGEEDRVVLTLSWDNEAGGKSYVRFTERALADAKASGCTIVAKERRGWNSLITLWNLEPISIEDKVKIFQANNMPQ